MKKIVNSVLALRKINYIKLVRESLFFLRFFCLVIFYLFFDAIRIFSNIWGIKTITKPFRKVVKHGRDHVLAVFNSKNPEEISSLDLILLAIRHLKVKRTRTIITVGGMAIGFGSVIFLLSLGYGTQKLVISRVARLDEMKQVTVTTGQASSLKLNDKTVETFKEIENVTAVLPLVSIVSKVNYNNSVSDVVVYGVSRAYLEESAIKTTKGTLFEDGSVSSQAPENASEGQVAGVSIEVRKDAKMNKQIAQLRYSIYPLEWKAVYSQPSEDSKIIGYTNRVPGQQNAVEVWGQTYISDANTLEGQDLYGNSFQSWVKDTYPIWEKSDCTEDNPDCSDSSYVLIKEGTQQKLQEGYITEDKVSLERYNIIAETQPVFSEGDVVETVSFKINNNDWIQVFSEPSKDTEQVTIFTTQDTNDSYAGELIYGEEYSNVNGWGSVTKNKNGKNLGLWIRAKMPLWRKLDCQDCKNMYLTERDAQDQQVYSSVIIRADTVSITDMPLPPHTVGQVLGDSVETEGAQLNSITADSESTGSALGIADDIEISMNDGTIIAAVTGADGSVDWVSIASTSASLNTEKRDMLKFPPSSKREAVVNQAMLSVLGLSEADALGQTFSSVLKLDEEFFDTEQYQAESESTNFTIIGIIPGDKNPAYYIAFSDIKGLGVTNYSQLKVIAKNPSSLAEIRRNIESQGFKTVSVVDTVGKINSLFDTIRVVLTLLGLVALGVAALGMFNTLTVSLLEKTREVGLMKAIGMKSSEVQRLFLAESIVMGLSGGIFGLLFSAVAGYILSILLSTLSLSKGLGFINVVDTPMVLALSIVGVSFLVGVLTGLYPSHRATKISALNALRYE